MEEGTGMEVIKRWGLTLRGKGVRKIMGTLREKLRGKGKVLPWWGVGDGSTSQLL